ncbi:hypothetical protein [Vibrio alginolyticus]|uniref:hypothetical protein n=1 Tax=Vibrio alginolyticus TaxID=663 RepID=UPI00215DFC9B|nr:hypothetical protein [Vibrio alginolyticus]MCS0161615.1 hypothetical protein [Vibrio alginolyticus]MCS0210112.1 hypothetical protein [Vibrio alginolyticus]
MKRLLSVGLIAMLAGCATIEKETRIPSTLKASEFNSVASLYMPKPTFVSYESFSSGENVLAVKMTTYGIDQYSNSESTIRYSQAYAEKYIDLIDKYLEWNKIALQRKDIVNKEIGREAAWTGGTDAELKFSFYSGNENSHFLAVSFCTMLICLDDKSHYYDAENAVKLKSLLEKLSVGSISQANVEDVYN